MIKSMTGFAQNVSSDDNCQITIVLRTYNNRFLDINLRVANVFSPVEDRIKSYIASRVTRGRVEVSIQYNSPDKFKNGQLTINLPLARNYWGLLTDLKKDLDISGPIDLGLLLSLKDIFVYQEASLSEEVLWKKLSSPLEKAFDHLQQMRQEEGKNLSRDLLQRIKVIEKTAENIRQRVPTVIESYQIRLTERIQKLVKGMEVDPMRLAQEVALIVDRSDISEELVRLGSHLKQLKTLFKEKQPAGKKMEFLLQEINREVNTIGSKSMDSSISHQVVAIKAELEKLREQVQNIE